MTHSQSFHVASHAEPPAATPALLNRRSTCPKVSIVFFARCSTSLRFETSVFTVRTFAPAAFSAVSASTSFELFQEVLQRIIDSLDENSRNLPNETVCFYQGSIAILKMGRDRLSDTIAFDSHIHPPLL
jgi:hypothetical protein